MTREKINEKLNELFREIFDDETITVKDETVAGDIDGWDSLMHITLIGSVEDEFDVQFDMKDVVALKNVGQMIDLIEKQLN